MNAHILLLPYHPKAIESTSVYLRVTLSVPLSCRFLIRGKPPNKNAAVLNTHQQRSKKSLISKM